MPDAGPHEAVKLRLLNGTHSMLAYVGGLAGARTVAGAWGDPSVAAVGALLGDEDLEPTLPEAPGIDIAAYRAELGQRWINPRIAHRLEQIGADGSQKLPARFAEPARRRLADGAPPRWIALVMAAWARHLGAPGERARRCATPAPSRCSARSRPRTAIATRRQRCWRCWGRRSPARSRWPTSSSTGWRASTPTASRARSRRPCAADLTDHN